MASKQFKFMHLIRDEKFADYLINNFRNANPIVEHDFFVFKTTSNVKHVKSKGIIVRNYNSKISNELQDSFSRYDCIVVHFLYKHFAELIYSIRDQSIVVIWGVWGGDIYNVTDKRLLKILLPDTKKLFTKQVLLSKDFIKYKIKSLLRGDTYKSQEKALLNIDFVATILPSDFIYIRENYKNSQHLKNLNINYNDSTTLAVNSHDPKLTDTGNILLGNSATYTNNHLEILKMIDPSFLGSRSIIAPLSYGSNKYAEHIGKVGNDIFGDQFIPLYDFIEKDKYLELINSCKILIINSMRQQAVSTILSFLFREADVFINPQNPLFEYYQDNGFRIYNVYGINDYLSSNSNYKMGQTLHNSSIAKRLYNKGTTIKNYQNIVNNAIEEREKKLYNNNLQKKY